MINIGSNFNPKKLPAPEIPRIKSKLCKITERCFNQRIIKIEIKIKERGSPNQASRKIIPPRPTARINKTSKIIFFLRSKFKEFNYQ